MLLVARIDALRTVAGEKIAVELQTRDLLQNRHAHFLSAARIDGRFVYDHRAAAHDGTDCLTGAPERSQVRALVVIDWCWHRDDKYLAGLERAQVSRKAQPLGALEFGSRHLEGYIAPATQLRDAFGFDVKTDRLVMLAELHRQRQTDVSESDDANAALSNLWNHIF